MLLYATDLQSFIPRFRTQSLDGLDVVHQIAYLRIYTALYELVSVHALEEEYGDRQNYLTKIEFLYLELRSRSAHHFDVENNLLLLYTLDRFAVYSQLISSHECWEQIAVHVEEAVASYADAPASELYPFLHLIGQLWRGVEGLSEDSLPDSYVFYQNQLHLLEKSGWNPVVSPAVQSVEALERLVLLCEADSTTVSAPDSRTVQQLVHQLIRTFRSRCLQPFAEKELRQLIRLYDCVSSLPFAWGREELAKISQMLQEQLDFLEHEAAVSIQISAVLIEQICRQIADEVQSEALRYMENS